MKFTNFLTLFVTVAVLPPQTSFAMRPGASINLWYECHGAAFGGTRPGPITHGDSRLTREADGGFTVNQFEETRFPCFAARSPQPRVYETQEGYSVQLPNPEQVQRQQNPQQPTGQSPYPEQQQRQQQMNPQQQGCYDRRENRRWTWTGPRVERLGHAIEILRERIVQDHPGCDPQFSSPYEVRNW